MRNKNSSEHPRKVKIGGIEQKVCMAKIRNFAEIAPNLPFTEYNFYEEYRDAFEKTDLGRMKKILPLHEMALPTPEHGHERPLRRPVREAVAERAAGHPV